MMVKLMVLEFSKSRLSIQSKSLLLFSVPSRRDNRIWIFLMLIYSLEMSCSFDNTFLNMLAQLFINCAIILQAKYNYTSKLNRIIHELYYHFTSKVQLVLTMWWNVRKTKLWDFLMLVFLLDFLKNFNYKAVWFYEWFWQIVCMWLITVTQIILYLLFAFVEIEQKAVFMWPHLVQNFTSIPMYR